VPGAITSTIAGSDNQNVTKSPATPSAKLSWEGRNDAPLSATWKLVGCHESALLQPFSAQPLGLFVGHETRMLVRSRVVFLNRSIGQLRVRPPLKRMPIKTVQDAHGEV
jgi:hypothetical protein